MPSPRITASLRAPSGVGAPTGGSPFITAPWAGTAALRRRNPLPLKIIHHDKWSATPASPRHDQKEDLTRQAERLLASGCDQVFKDIGSGLSCRKPGLRQLLRGILQGRFDVVRVVHEDRLLRFSVDLVRRICRHADTRLEVLEVRPSVSFETELARDVITLMTVFCARLYGKRSHRNKAAGARRSPLGACPLRRRPSVRSCR